MIKIFGLVALLALSVSAFAEKQKLPTCGGIANLFADSSAPSGYSLRLEGVQNCSNVSVAGSGFSKFDQNAYSTFNLSRESVIALKNQGIAVAVKSNSGKTSDVVYFKVASGPRYIHSLGLGECGGKLELYKQASGRLSVKFIGVTKCSNFIINQTQESYKLTDGQGDYQTRNFTLSNEASRYYQLNLTLKSNSGKTRFDIILTNP